MQVPAALETKPFRYARFIFTGTAFIVELVYERPCEPEQPLSEILAIDVGVNVLVAGVSTVASPFIISGKPVKAVNQWYNKEKARLQHIYAQQQEETGQKLLHLCTDRFFNIADYFHKTSRFLITYCQLLGIDTIVIGYNKGWKQQVNLGKKTNQHFVGVPLQKLVHQIQYKAEEVGLRVLVTDEAYTSCRSFLDGDPLDSTGRSSGRRLARGRYCSSTGVLLHADVHAAANIGRKVFPLRFRSGIVDVVGHPCCLTVWSNP